MQNPVLFHLQTLHRGRSNAISSKKLEAIFGIKGSELRQIVNELRSEGNPICSGDTGYYYAANETELNRTIAQLSSRANSITNARDGLVAALAVF